MYIYTHTHLSIFLRRGGRLRRRRCRCRDRLLMLVVLLHRLCSRVLLVRLVDTLQLLLRVFNGLLHGTHSGGSTQQ